MQSHSALGTRVAPAAKPSPRFFYELMGMCAVMCIGGEVLGLAAFQGFGWAGLISTAPAVAALIIVFNLIAPMTVYMLIRGHGWQHTVTMDASTVGVGALVILGIATGVISNAIIPSWHALFGIMCGPACILMFVQMFRDRDMYGGAMQHHAS